MKELELLEFCKDKIDRRMEKTDTTNNLREAPEELNGRYTDRLEPITASTWTHSFLTGAVAYMYYHYKEQKYLDFLYSLFEHYKNGIYNNLKEVGHDTGFAYALYATALYKITGDKKVWELALKAADELSKRHHYESGVIAAFCMLHEDKMNAIADDIMNLQLVMWAHSETGHCFYERVWKKHIQAVMTHMVREDFTVRHAFAFDKTTGAPICEKNWCGYACGSAWSRGNAWTIYGMASAAIHSRDYYSYMPTLNGISDMFIRQIEKTDYIPIWDFYLPEYENLMKDSSAAAIAASAFWNIDNKIPKNQMQGQILRAGEVSDKIFEELTKNYLAPQENENILTKAQTGSRNAGCVWGDYFFIELLMKRIHKEDTPNFWIND